MVMPQSNAAVSVTHWEKQRLEIDITDVQQSATMLKKAEAFVSSVLLISIILCSVMSGHFASCCQRTDSELHTHSLTDHVPLISIDQH